MYCSSCGAQIPDNATFCPSCGLSTNVQWGTSYQQPIYTQQPVYAQQSRFQIPTGMLVWSIISIFLCTIPGIIAAVLTVLAKDATSQEDYDNKIRIAKILNIVSLVIFIIAFVGIIAAAFLVRYY